MTDDIAMPRQRLAFMDLETWSDVPIRHGAWAYAEGAEVMLWAYALNDGPVAVWDLTSGEPMPAALAAILVDDDITTVWHNGSMFDTTVLKVALGIDIPLPRLHDTMVQALQHSLPGSLGALCEVLGVPSDKAKDKAGKDLIRLFCIPPAGNLKRGRATAATHPTEWARFKDYASLDIVAMRECYKRMPKWNCTLVGERAVFHVDQTINRRGMCMDIDLARAAVAAVDVAQVALREQTFDMTSGEVESATKRDAMMLHILTEYGVDPPDMQKSTLERRIADPELPEGLRELLRIRLQATTTSTSKYTALMNCVSSDGRLRGTKQYCGAARTGRWAGRLFQPDNLPRPTMKNPDIELGIEALKAGIADLLYDNVMQLTSNAIRGCITAPPGKKLVVADLSNIEGRVLAWLAGETWKLKAFRDYDAGTGLDLYILSYAKSFGVDPKTVTKNDRQKGKVQELALGYEGGVGAFVTFAAGYGIDLEELANSAQSSIPGNVWGQANIMLAWHRQQGREPAEGLGLSDRAWLVCESLKLGWRDAHANVVQLWRDVDAAVREAISTPGTTVQVRMLKIRRDGAWLRIVLPSGRALCYPAPKLEAEKKKRNFEVDSAGECAVCGGTHTVLVGGWQGEEPPGVAHLEACTACQGQVPTREGGRTKITYAGVNQYSRKWGRIDTYSGKIVENITQAVARDVMASSMVAIEKAGYAIVLTIHDEILAEAPDEPQYNAEHLAELMAEAPDWADGLPLAAAGFEAYRYRKD